MPKQGRGGYIWLVRGEPDPRYRKRRPSRPLFWSDNGINEVMVSGVLQPYPKLLQIYIGLESI